MPGFVRGRAGISGFRPHRVAVMERSTIAAALFAFAGPSGGAQDGAVKVTASVLNVRAGHGTGCAIEGQALRTAGRSAAT
jgi:hypothetical protein